MAGLPWDAVRAVAVGETEVVLVAPYIKSDALRRVLGLIPRDARLVCVSRWRATDLLAGVSDVDCRRMITERDGEFRLHASLHAKYYRFGSVILIGSANLTGAGLGLTRNHNLEVLCQPGLDFNGSAFERAVLDESRVVSDAEFAHWSGLRPLIDAAEQTGFHIHQADYAPYDWQPKTREPEHLWRAYRGESDLIPSAEERNRALSDLQDLCLPPGLERSEFSRWIATSLLGSAFTSRVLSLWKNDWDSARALLAAEWGMEAAESSRAKETAELWLARFLPYIPQRPSHSSCIASV